MMACTITPWLSFLYGLKSLRKNQIKEYDRMLEIGVEPMRLSFPIPHSSNADYVTRTHDPLFTRQVLYQLS